jgi:acyl-CoA thioesterase
MSPARRGTNHTHGAMFNDNGNLILSTGLIIMMRYCLSFVYFGNNKEEL